MSKRAKVIVFGANGIVGSSLCEALPSAQIELTAVSRQKPLNAKVDFIKHSAANNSADLLKKIKGKIDVIIINSGYISETNSFEGQTNNFTVNLKYVFDILEFAESKNVKKIIYTSTLSFLKKPFLKTITEKHPVAIDNLYSAAKFMAESAVISFCQKNKMDFFCFRIPSPVNTKNIDLHNNVLKVWNATSEKGNNITVFGKGKRHQNFLKTKDLAEIYMQAITNRKKSGIYNLASTSSLNMKDLAAMIAKKNNVKVFFDRSKVEDVSYKGISIKKLKSEFDLTSFSSSKEVIMDLIKNTK